MKLSKAKDEERILKAEEINDVTYKEFSIRLSADLSAETIRQ